MMKTIHVYSNSNGYDMDERIRFIYTKPSRGEKQTAIFRERHVTFAYID